MNRVIVGLGSNIEPGKNIHKAKAILAQGYNILAESHLAITNPVGEAEQSDFINGAILLETELNINQLETSLKKTESDFGENTHHDNKPIDLDIVTWNREIIDPDFHNRDYLKQSVLELIPDLDY